MPEISSQADILWWFRPLTRTEGNKSWLEVRLDCNSRNRPLSKFVILRASTNCEARKEFSLPRHSMVVCRKCEIGMDWGPFQASTSTRLAVSSELLPSICGACMSVLPSFCDIYCPTSTPGYSRFSLVQERSVP